MGKLPYKIILIFILTLAIISAGYFFRKRIFTYIVNLDTVRFTGEVLSWNPQNGILKVQSTVKGKVKIFDLTADPQATNISISADKETLQKTGKNVRITIQSQSDSEYKKAFCTSDKVKIIATKDEYEKLSRSNTGQVEAIDNIGERKCI